MASFMLEIYLFIAESQKAQRNTQPLENLSQIDKEDNKRWI